MTRASQALLIVSVLLLAAFLGLFPLQNYDVWMHLASGRYIVEHGELPYGHPFNFTASARQWIDQEWLSQTALYLLHQRIGIDGLVLLKALLGAVAVGLSLWLALRRGAELPTAVALTLVTMLLLRPGLTVRPHLMTLVLLAFWALLLGGWTGRRWRPYLLVGSMVLWANLHAGFLAGLILLGIYWVEALWRWRRSGPTARPDRRAEARSLGFLLLACVGATLMNPYGWRLWTYPFTLITMRVYMEYIQEWMRPDWSTRFWLLYGYLGLGSVLLLWQRRRLRPADALVWVVFGVMALSARRHIAPFALLSAPVLAVALGPSARRRTVGDKGLKSLAPVLAAVALVAIGLHAALGACPNLPRPGIREHFFPEGAARYLREHGGELPRHLYNRYDWGGYLEWSTWPEWQVFIDGECVVFGEGIFAEWDTVYKLKPGWRQVLADREVNCVIRDWDLKEPDPLVGTGEWVTVYWDDVAMVLVRRQGVSDEFLAAHDLSLTNPAWLLNHPPGDAAVRQKAFRQLDDAERRFGPSGIGHHMRGALLYQQGSYEEALDEFKADIVIGPELARSWAAAGDCWRKLGWLEEAITHYRKALAMRPGLALPRIQLALLYEKQGKLRAALKELDYVDGLSFDDPQLRHELRSKISELKARRH